MKIRLPAALCLISMVTILGAGYFGVAIAGNLDTEQTRVADEDAFFLADSVSLEPGAAGSFPAPVEKTGQTMSFGTRDDAKLQKGVAWPNPRFTDNGNGTVTDNLTGLIWLKDANCTVFYAGDATGSNPRTWSNALKAANKLADGACGLTDGSVAGNWRLPNVKELASLIHYGFNYPTLPNTDGTGKWTEGDPFSSVAPYSYWTSSTYLYVVRRAWIVSFTDGRVVDAPKTRTHFVWPVRGGQ